MKALEGVERAAIVVAHPDDEALWFAGLAIRFPGIEWSIVCCTVPRRDPRRAQLFEGVCADLGAESVLLWEQEPAATSSDLRHLDAINLTHYGVVATHNEAGEYGHLHHQAVHRYVRDHFDGPILVPGYGWQDGPEVIELTEAEKARKRAAIMAYDHKSPSDGGLTKGEALLKRYGNRFDLWRETYHVL